MSTKLGKRNIIKLLHWREMKGGRQLGEGDVRID